MSVRVCITRVCLSFLSVSAVRQVRNCLSMTRGWGEDFHPIKKNIYKEEFQNKIARKIEKKNIIFALSEDI